MCDSFINKMNATLLLRAHLQSQIQLQRMVNYHKLLHLMHMFLVLKIIFSVHFRQRHVDQRCSHFPTSAITFWQIEKEHVGNFTSGIYVTILHEVN